MKEILKAIGILTILWMAAKNASADNVYQNKAEFLAKRILDHGKEVMQATRKYCDDQNLALAVIKVESDFKVDAINKHSLDYGLMQVSIWHVEKKNLDRAALLSSADYNVRHGCEILNWFVKRYGTYEGVARYNCGTRKSCPSWNSVRKYKKKVLYYKRVLDLRDKKLI